MGENPVGAPSPHKIFFCFRRGLRLPIAPFGGTKSNWAGPPMRSAIQADDRFGSDCRPADRVPLRPCRQLAKSSRPTFFVGQLTWAFTLLKKGLDPDNPRNLSRVVVPGRHEFLEKA